MSEKTPFIVIGVLLIILLIGFFVWVYVSSRNQTGLFKPYQPELAQGLNHVIPPSKFNQPLTEEQKANRERLIQEALEKARSKRLGLKF